MCTFIYLYAFFMRGSPSFIRRSKGDPEPTKGSEPLMKQEMFLLPPRNGCCFYEMEKQKEECDAPLESHKGI